MQKQVLNIKIMKNQVFFCSKFKQVGGIIWNIGISNTGNSFKILSIVVIFNVNLNYLYDYTMDSHNHYRM